MAGLGTDASFASDVQRGIHGPRAAQKAAVTGISPQSLHPATADDTAYTRDSNLPSHPVETYPPGAKLQQAPLGGDIGGRRHIDTSNQRQQQHMPAAGGYQGAGGGAAGVSMISGIKDVPITLERPPPGAELADAIPNPGMPRATRAVDREHPQGSAGSNDSRTVLQQHVAFWDRNNNGVIWPWDTYTGFRRLGFGYLISAAAVPFIHGSFSYPTLKGWLPHPLFPIYTERMHKTKHGSDSEVYDTEGRFVPEKFEEIFSKYDRGNKGGLSWADMQAMVYGNSNIGDPVGWVAERLEWWVTYMLLKDSRGIVSKDKIRRVFDGTIWEAVAQEVEMRRKRLKWE